MFNVEFPDNLFDAEFLSDEKLDAALEKVAPDLVRAMQSQINAVTTEKSTGEAANSIKANKPKTDKQGRRYISVTPHGYSTHTFNRGSRKYKITNAIKLIWLQHGIPGRQEAKPWLLKAQHKCEDAITKALENEITKDL